LTPVAFWVNVCFAAVRPPVAASHIEMASQGETMIAQVFTCKIPLDQITDETRKAGEEALAEARAYDGVEGALSVLDPATGDYLAINLFRDQAALDAIQAFSKQKIAEGQEIGAEVTAIRVYSEVIANL
jgi:hypothetical protein